MTLRDSNPSCDCSLSLPSAQPGRVEPEAGRHIGQQHRQLSVLIRPHARGWVEQRFSVPMFWSRQLLQERSLVGQPGPFGSHAIGSVAHRGAERSRGGSCTRRSSATRPRSTVSRIAQTRIGGLRGAAWPRPEPGDPGLRLRRNELARSRVAMLQGAHPSRGQMHLRAFACPCRVLVHGRVVHLRRIARACGGFGSHMCRSVHHGTTKLSRI